MTKQAAPKLKFSAQTGQVGVEGLYGAKRAQFRTSVTFGRSGVHHVKAEASTSEIAEAARELRERPDCPTHALHGGIRRGRGGWQQIPVPRAMLLGIADALAGVIDDDDAGHRFYHWESPSTPRPCSSCRETRGADDAPSRLRAPDSCSRGPPLADRAAWAATLAVAQAMASECPSALEFDLSRQF